MNRRRFVPQAPKHVVLSERLATRLPLELALSLSVELVDAVATAHSRRQVYGKLTAADFVVQADGSVAITAPVDPHADMGSDTFAVGAVLYQVFTGLTPSQARAKLSVSPLHAVPPASLLNPALDDSIEILLAKLLAREPALRPHSLRVVEALLADACEALDLEASREALAAWAAVPAAPKKHVPTFAVIDDDDLEEEEDEEAPRAGHDGPMRFDLWAAAACAFTVVAFAMATTL